MASLIPFYAPAQTHAKKTLHQGAVRILYRVGIRPKNVNHLREAECSLSSAATNIPKPSETALPRFLSIPRCSSGVFFELFRFPPIRYRPAETTGSNVNPREAAMQQETFHWPHKDLLDVDQLTQEELFHLLDTAANLHEINSRPVKKVPILKGKASSSSSPNRAPAPRPLLTWRASAFPPTPSGWRNPVPASRKAKA